MKKTICILTATRAEYGLLKPLIKRLKAADKHMVKMVVTGAHLSPSFGLTYKEIESDGFDIDKKIDMLVEGDSPLAINKSMALLQLGMADYLGDLRPDMLIVLGDRYETLSAATAAMVLGIPICHLYGGETTEGAMDEAIRHAITKMSYLHFTSTDSYKKRVIQLGESPDRVFNVGALGVENALHTPLMTKIEIADSLGMSLDTPYAVVTYHPETLSSDSVSEKITMLLDVLANDTSTTYIITKANADSGGRVVNAVIDTYASKYEHLNAFTSLGMLRYLSTVKYSDFVIGNSSSGLIEVPSFGVPTINIGDRQKGRIAAKSVINCEATKNAISDALKLVHQAELKANIQSISNPYEGFDTSNVIAKIIDEFLLNGEIRLAKAFYDIESRAQ